MKTIVKYVSLVAGFVVFGYIGNKAIDAFVQNNKSITTDGVAFKKVDSDFAVLNISIRNETNILSEINEKRKAEKKAVMAFLLAQGIENSEITEEGASVEDQLRWITEKAEGKKKYIVKDLIKIKTQKVSNIKKVIENLSELLEKNICIENTEQYSYMDMKKLRAEMGEEALKEAKERAQHIAKSSNMEIGKIKTVEVQQFSMTSADKSDISDGDWDQEKSLEKKVKATVRATFDLR